MTRYASHRVIIVSTEQYLIFNARCAACRQVAEIIHLVAGERLTLLDIHGPQAHASLCQAYPHGWKRAPYLVVVDHNGVSAWTDAGATVRLGWLLDVRGSW